MSEIDPRCQRLGNLIANLAHPRGDHRENALEDEAHDLIRELQSENAALRALVDRAAVILSDASAALDDEEAVDPWLRDSMRALARGGLSPDAPDPAPTKARPR